MERSEIRVACPAFRCRSMRATRTCCCRERKPPPGRPGGGCCLTPLLSDHSGGGSQVAEPLEVLLLLLVAWRQLEQAGRGAAQDVVLGLFRQELQVVDGRGQVEVPVRIIRGVE